MPLLLLNQSPSEDPSSWFWGQRPSAPQNLFNILTLHLDSNLFIPKATKHNRYYIHLRSQMLKYRLRYPIQRRKGHWPPLTWPSCSLMLISHFRCKNPQFHKWGCITFLTHSLNSDNLVISAGYPNNTRDFSDPIPAQPHRDPSSVTYYYLKFRGSRSNLRISKKRSDALILFYSWHSWCPDTTFQYLRSVDSM
jgi:hypothetical protein